jgi:RHS repeat-associated protein
MTVGGVTTDYAYDGTMLVREFQTNQQTGLLAPSATYMAGPMGPCCRINEQNQSEGYYPAGVTSTTPLSRGVTRWYVYDGLGSKIAELDDNNNITTSRQYDVYGAPRAGTQQGVAATSSQGYVGSLGHVTDQSTGGLIYMQARYYDPVLGRFVNEDPEGSGSNWYIYCSDSPACLTDSDGQFAGELTYDASAASAGFGALGNLLVVIAVVFAAEVLLASSDESSNSGQEKADEQTADEIISGSRRGSIRGRFPGQLLDKTLKEIDQLAKSGDKAAQTARKLLTDNRFKK